MFSKDGKTKDVATPRICDVVWHNGEFIKWGDARVHVMSHVLHYGSSVFEGIRCYSTKKGPAIFRLREHIQRLRSVGPQEQAGHAVLTHRDPDHGTSTVSRASRSVSGKSRM